MSASENPAMLRKLGRTGPLVHPIGFGAWALGGQWGNQDDGESVRALHKALDLGVNLIDTAAVYGDGRSERIIARALAERKEKPILATKTPPVAGPWPPTPWCDASERYPEKYLIENVEERLRNLKVERIDLLQLHTWTRAWNRDPKPLEVLAKLKKQGKIGLIGICTPEQDQNSVIGPMRLGLVDVVQVIFNLFDQEAAAGLLPETVRHQAGVIVRVPLDEGSLSGKYKPDHKFPEGDFRSRYFEGDRLARTLTRIDAIKADIAEAKLGPEWTLPRVAIRYAMDQPGVTIVIPGMRNSAQAEDNTSVANLPQLPEELTIKLRRHNWLRGVWYGGK